MPINVELISASRRDLDHLLAASAAADRDELPTGDLDAAIESWNARLDELCADTPETVDDLSALAQLLVLRCDREGTDLSHMSHAEFRLAYKVLSALAKLSIH